MQQQLIDGALLRRYTDGDCTKEELHVVRQYLQDPAYQESLYEWLQQDWQQVVAGAFPPEPKTTGSYQQFIALVQPVTPVVKQLRLRWWKAAAAALFIGIMSWSGWQWQQSEKQRQRATLENQWICLRNDPGKRTSLVLPDSSQVYLNAASNLRYNKNYGITNRDITLEGEAFFIVKHGGQHPFSVHTGNLTTIDIGTAFNIRYRSTDSVIKIAVAEGAVDVMDSGQSKVRTLASLTQMQLLNFSKNTRQAIVQTLPDTELIGGWRQGILVFRKQQLRDVAAELEKYYGIHIRIARSETANMLITTTIRNATVAEALDIIAMTTSANITTTGGEILIK